MVKPEKYGFTTIELLTVIAIIGMLVAILVPAMNMVRNTAKRTQQKAQLTSIDVALMTFKTGKRAVATAEHKSSVKLY